MSHNYKKSPWQDVPLAQAYNSYCLHKWGGWCNRSCAHVCAVVVSLPANDIKFNFSHTCRIGDNTPWYFPELRKFSCVVTTTLHWQRNARVGMLCKYWFLRQKLLLVVMLWKQYLTIWLLLMIIILASLKSGGVYLAIMKAYWNNVYVHIFIFRIPMLVGTLHKAIMTPLLPNTMVMSQTDMEPAVEERLPWQKITISVA